MLQRKPEVFYLKQLQDTTFKQALQLPSRGSVPPPTPQKGIFTQTQLSSALPEEEETSWF